MRIRCYGLLAMALLLGLGTPSRAIAQDQELSPEAKTAVDAGLAATQRQDWKSSIQYFLEAQRAAPEVTKIWFYLGLASAKQPGYEYRSVAWFKAYLLANPNVQNADAIKAQILRSEISYESRLSALIDPLESLARSLALNDGPSSNSWALANLGATFAAMRLDLGDDSGADQTKAAFGVPALYSIRQESRDRAIDTRQLIAIGRNGFRSDQLSVDYDDTALDQYVASLKEHLLAASSSVSTDLLMETATSSLAELFNSYRKLRGLYGRVEAVPDATQLAAALSGYNFTYDYWYGGTVGQGSKYSYTYTDVVKMNGCTFYLESHNVMLGVIIGSNRSDRFWEGNLGDIDPASIAIGATAANIDPKLWDLGFSSQGGSDVFTYRGDTLPDAKSKAGLLLGTEPSSLLAPLRALVRHCAGSGEAASTDPTDAAPALAPSPFPADPGLNAASGTVTKPSASMVAPTSVADVTDKIQNLGTSVALPLEPTYYNFHWKDYSSTLQVSGCVFTVSMHQVVGLWPVKHGDQVWTGNLGAIDPATVAAGSEQTSGDTSYWELGFRAKRGTAFDHRGWVDPGGDEVHKVWAFVKVDPAPLIAPLRAMIGRCSAGSG